MDEILFTAEEGMDKALDFMKHEFSSVRTGKASPALVEGIEVDAYGSVMKLKQLALISTPEPRLIVIQPFDASTISSCGPTKKPPVLFCMYR
jgi:ribosome recycling factor